jgi:hypothetical protein
MDPEALYCNPINPIIRVCSPLRWRSGHRQEAVQDETAGVIAYGCLRFPDTRSERSETLSGS